MSNIVRISTEDNNLRVDWGLKSGEIYSFMLFQQFAKQLPEFIAEKEHTFIFNTSTTNESERRILQIIDDLKKEYGDFEVSHDTHISKNIEAFKKEKEDFSKFSEQARRIRDNEEHDFSQLDSFEKSLENLNRNLFWHQKLSAYHLAYSRNACNFSVPGSGKTTVVYAVYNYLRKIGEVDKLIVVGPSSSAIAWVDEFEEVFGKVPNSLLINGDTSSSMINSMYSQNGPEVIHITYNSLPKYIEQLKYYNTKHNVMMVVDEAHRIKNTEGFWAKSLLDIVDDIETAPVSRVVLTGTPAPNSYVDLVNLFKFVWPKNDIIGYPQGVLKQMNNNPRTPNNRKRIKEMIQSISPYYIRINKSDLGLPPVTINSPLVAEPDELHKEIYEFIKNDFMKFIKTDKSHTSFGLRLIRLRQAASNPSLLRNPVFMDGFEGSDNFEADESYLNGIMDKIIEFDENHLSTKFSVTIDKVKELANSKRKVLIWCEFINTSIKLGELIQAEGYKVAFLNGQTSSFDERKEIVEDFNDPKGEIEVIIASPQAVGESISLHKQCHDAIYFEISYNAGLHLQSMDRIHRLGLPEGTETNYWYIQSDFPIEATVLDKVRQKEKKMREIVESSEIPLIADYKDLFEDPFQIVDLREILKSI